MNLIDISMTYEIGMRRYPGMDDFSFQWERHYSLGNEMAQSRFSMCTHLGTHIDAPLHFVKGGRRADQIALEALVGRAQIIDARGLPCIDAVFLEHCDLHTPRLLFLTDNTKNLQSDEPFGNVYFDESACELMVGRGTLVCGIDWFGVDRYGDKARAAHRPLLDGGVVVIEGLALQGVEPGDYELWCLPLKLQLEGAPCRTVLVSE